MDESIGLLDRIDKGSVEAFDQFYEDYAPFVYKIAISLTKNRNEAEDLCHDVFLEVYRKSHQFNPNRGSVKAWLAVKTRSRFLDSIRKRNRWQTEEVDGQIEDLLVDVSSEERAITNLQNDLIRRAISQLPKTQKEALFSKFYQLKTQKEIATDMQKPIGTIKSFIRYGLINLRKQLAQVGMSGGESRHDKL